MQSTLRMAARCSAQAIVKMAIAASLLLATGIAAGTITSVGLTLFVGLTLVFFAVHGGWALARAMHTFAERVPADPDTTVSTGGRIQLSWPSLSLRIEGTARIIRVAKLEAVAGGVPMSGGLDEAAELAGQALDHLGVQPDDPPDSNDA